MKNLLAFCVIVATACQGGDDDESPEPTDADTPECLRHSDCEDSVNGTICSSGLCVPCEPASIRGTRDLGCEAGNRCFVSEDGINRLCVPIDPICEADTDCDALAPICHRGFCAQCTEDTDCPDHGEDECVNIECANFTCSREDVCACSEDADCDDGNSCTTDLCHISGACRHEPQPNCPTTSTSGGTTGGGGGSGSGTTPPAGTITANCTWTPPSGTGTFSSATMSMAVAGGPLTTLCTQSAGAAVTCTRTGLSPGQTLDVSVEYVAGGTASWSCVGNGASGSGRGTLSCSLSTGATLSNWLPVANGLSSGCNLRATIAS